MRNQKEQLFEGATKKLIERLDSMGLDALSRMQAKNFVLLFRDSFKLDTVKHATFSQAIGNDYKLFPYDAYGFCKAASCSFVSLMPKKDWQLMYINEIWTHGPHYYVQHVKTKQVLDFTFDQYVYDGFDIPYHMGYPIKIDAEAQATTIRFLHAIGIDFMQAIKNNNAKE